MNETELLRKLRGSFFEKAIRWHETNGENMELTELKGIGPKTEKLFQKLGIWTVEDLVYYFPHTYLSFPKTQVVGSLVDGEQQAVMGMLEKDATVVNLHGLLMTTAYVRDLSGKLRLCWFNAAFLKSTLRAGTVLVFLGKVTSFKGQKTMQQPRIFRPEEYEAKPGTLEPVYGQTKGLSNTAILKAVRQAMDVAVFRPDFVPENIRYNRTLMDMRTAVRAMHFPESVTQFEAARKRLAFNELFLFSLALAEKKAHHAAERSRFVIEAHPDVAALVEKLPFQLTEGQKAAVQDITADLRSGFVMNRLVQGDVGSGKTIVAFLAMLETALSGYQAALMAPTEILAEQHYVKMKAMIEEHALPLRPVLVTGSMTAKERKTLYTRIATHDADLIIGTHALFQEKVVYDRLALVITDEQHRFGVNQRQELSEKGQRPHTLVMSATPIPRTLAMLVYADMQVSLIREKPADRLPIRNAVVDENYRKNAYKFIYEEIRKGRQAYIICPMVEPNDMLDLENVSDYVQKIRKIFPKEVKIGKLHGKMKPAEKEDIMARFLAREIDLLVSTTVVEVGVDVPNATVMMVENAERFGLAQLHQLRGRVGRSEHQSFCIFVDTQNSEKSKQRLQILAHSNDGFEIAEQDLKLRGPGDIFGVRQSGALDFAIADIYEDGALLREAAEDASFVLKTDAALSLPEHAELRKALDRFLAKSCTL